MRRWNYFESLGHIFCKWDKPVKWYLLLLNSCILHSRAVSFLLRFLLYEQLVFNFTSFNENKPFTSRMNMYIDFISHCTQTVVCQVLLYLLLHGPWSTGTKMLILFLTSNAYILIQCLKVYAIYLVLSVFILFMTSSFGILNVKEKIPFHYSSLSFSLVPEQKSSCLCLIPTSIHKHKNDECMRLINCQICYLMFFYYIQSYLICCSWW